MCVFNVLTSTVFLGEILRKHFSLPKIFVSSGSPLNVLLCKTWCLSRKRSDLSVKQIDLFKCHKHCELLS